MALICRSIFVSAKFAYGQLWGISVLLSETLRVDLLRLTLVDADPLVNHNALILFRIGWLIFGSRRSGLWLVVKFSRLSISSVRRLTLPVSLGYLNFCFNAWLQYWRDRAFPNAVTRFVQRVNGVWVFRCICLIWLVLVLYISHITYHTTHNMEYARLPARQGT